MVRRLFERDDDFGQAFTDLYGQAPDEVDDDTLLVFTGKALAAWQETLVSGRSAFDEFRDAVIGGRQPDASVYPEAAQRGAKIFMGKGNCSVCHFGPAFSNGEFASIGLPHMTADGRVDKGRFGGIEQLKSSPFNLLGRYNDDATGASRMSTRLVRQRHDSFGEFRVPGLRGVAATAPYMHDGSLATLADVVDHYADPDMERMHVDGDALVRPLGLTERERADLVAFLKTL